MSNQNWKQHFRRMNLDSDVRSMKPGDYRKLTNGTPIQPASTAYANAAQDIVCSIIGNQLVANSLPGGTNQIIGFVEDRKSNRLFYAAWNNTAANNSIYQYSATTGAIVLVMRTALFPWAQTDFLDMDIVGDILMFTNNRSDIQKINVAKAIAGGTYTPLAVELTLIKPMPLTPLTMVPAYDNNTPTDFISGHYFQFFERYIYEDYDYSVFGPASDITRWVLPSGTAVDYASTANQVNSGLYAVDGEPTFTDGERILLLGQTTATEDGIWVRHAGAWTRPTDFAHAGNKDTTVYVKGGIRNYEQVWRVKSTNVDTIAATKIRLQGPNYITVTRPSTPPATVIGIEYAVRIDASNEFIVYKTEKVGSFTSSHTFYNNSYLFTVPDADTFTWNDSVPLTTKSLKIFKNKVFLFNNTEGYTHVTTTQVGLTTTLLTAVPVTPSTGETIAKTIRVARGGGRYNVGVIFFDFAGRHSGVHCTNTITVPDDPSNKYAIVVDLTPIAADIPAWAVRNSVVCTKELTTSFFVSQYTQDIYFYKKKADGTYTYNKDLTSFSADGTVIDISALTKERRGYTLNPGDRIKLYVGSNNIIETKILSQDGKFVYVRVLGELDTSTILSTAPTNLLFVIYTPKTPAQEPFYETGLTASGNLTGDVELGNHLLYTCPTAGYSATDPFANVYNPQPNSAFLNQLEDMSVWDNNFPLWPTPAGRPMVQTDSRQINKYVYLRFGQNYILNANFLGLNTFYALDEQALPVENGAGTRLAEAGEVLVAIHEVETEAVYVGQGFVKVDSGANQFLTKTDTVIGDARKYLGGHGSIHPASVVVEDGRVYYLDLRKGYVIRRSQDGLTKVSDEQSGIQGLISSLCNTHATLATSRIIAGWDPQYKCYCLSFIDTSGPSGTTLYYHEASNAWVFQADFLPEFWGRLNQNQFAFLSGACWIQTLEGNYNKFFGVQKNRQIDIEFAPLNTLMCIWDAVEVDAEKIYVTGGSNEVVLSLYHKNGDTLQTQINYLDFQLRESDRVWRSAFFRWMQDQNFTGPNALVQSKYFSVRRVRGQSAFVTLVYNGTDRNPMKSITIYYTPSMQSNP